MFFVNGYFITEPQIHGSVKPLEHITLKMIKIENRIEALYSI
jgi:hypothetical protein